MAKLKHFIIDGYCYFLTSTTKWRKQIFNNFGNAQILCDIIYRNLLIFEKMGSALFLALSQFYLTISMNQK